MTQPTYEELKARLAKLEAQLAPARKPIEFFVTHAGEFQIRHALQNGSAHNLPSELLTVLFNNAPTIVKFLEDHKGLLNNSSDDQNTLNAKQEARATAIADGSTVVRKPRQDKSAIV